ncbi:hypothetical protein MGH68_07260 [Erysipelothrix sp. D19-032]
MKLKNINTEALVQKIREASMEGKSEAIVQAMQALLDDAMSEQVAQYREMARQTYKQMQSNGRQVWIASIKLEETDFYQKITTGAYTTEQDNLLPTTVLTYLYEDLKKSRPLFAHIDWAPKRSQKMDCWRKNWKSNLGCT